MPFRNSIKHLKEDSQQFWSFMAARTRDKVLECKQVTHNNSFPSELWKHHLIINYFQYWFIILFMNIYHLPLFLVSKTATWTCLRTLRQTFCKWYVFLGTEPRASGMLGKCSIIKLQSSSGPSTLPFPLFNFWDIVLLHHPGCTGASPGKSQTGNPASVKAQVCTSARLPFLGKIQLGFNH